MILWLLACTGETVIHDGPPEVAILAPGEGSTVAAGVDLEVVARVQDALDDTADLALLWTVGGAEASGDLVIDGVTVRWTLPGGLDVGEHVIGLNATDPSGYEAADEVGLVATLQAPPTIALDAPGPGPWLASAPIPVAAQAADPDAASLTELVLTWGGVAAGDPAAPAHPDASGRAAFALEGVGPGTWELTVSASDGVSQASAQASFEVVSGDDDEDGYVAASWGGPDCDDADPDVHPGAAERCDGVDEDCDGLVDDGATDVTTWHRDADGDGYGDPAKTQQVCTGPSGWVLDGTDCDDARAVVHPGATETCDGVDEDCDGTADEGAALVRWRDADGDGHGDPDNAKEACAFPGGWVDDDTDCDDADADVFPGAPERCNEVDDDCDGALPADEKTDADGDGYVKCADCADADKKRNPGAKEVCDGLDQDCSGKQDDNAASCPCPVRWHGGHAYLYCATPKDWPSAGSACASVGYHLVKLETKTEDEAVFDTANTFSFAYWWIGLNDRATPDDWRWEDGTKATYQHWGAGEPNNLLGNEACVELNRFTDGGWNDQPCDWVWNYICEAG